MIPKLPRPGAHNHIEGAPPDSLDFVREVGESPIGTPASEARERRMQNPEYAREARTLTVRFTYLRKGHPRAALEAVLASISKAVFETEILDA
jgi:hypothetical protein